MIHVTATALVENQGTILVFEGVADLEDGPVIVTFAADHRPGYDIADAIAVHGEAVCGVPANMVLSMRPTEDAA